MARKANPATDFNVTVEGIGTFTFGRRRMADEFAIQRKYTELTDGLDDRNLWLAAAGGWIAALTVLTVRAPEGWDIDDMDPLDADTYKNLKKVFDALGVQEDSFRGKPRMGSQTGSETPGDHN